MIDISVRDFVDGIFVNLDKGEVPIVRQSHLKDDGRLGFSSTFSWFVDDYHMPSGGPLHMCISTVDRFEHVSGVETRCKREHLRRCHCLVLDDIGTKAMIPNADAAPHWMLETSPGNFQAGYLLRPFDAQIQWDVFNACIAELANRANTDAGAKDTNRLVRVPGSDHLVKGFKSVLTEWHPDRPRWVFWDLMKEFGLRADDIRVGTRPMTSKARKRAIKAAVKALRGDPMAKWLVQNAHGRVVDEDRAISVICPWYLEHSECECDDLRYWPGSGGVKCFHAHCQGRTYDELAKWVIGKGGPNMRRYIDLHAEEAEEFWAELRKRINELGER